MIIKNSHYKARISMLHRKKIRSKMLRAKQNQSPTAQWNKKHRTRMINRQAIDLIVERTFTSRSSSIGFDDPTNWTIEPRMIVKAASLVQCMYMLDYCHTFRRRIQKTRGKKNNLPRLNGSETQDNQEARSLN